MDPSIAPLNPNLPYASILSLIHTHRDHQKHRLAQHHRMLLSTKSRGANAPTFAMPTSRRLIPCRLTAAAAAQVRAVSHTTTTARHLQVAAAAAASQAAVDVSAAGGAPQNQQQQTKQTQPQTRKKEFNWFKQWYPVALMDNLDPAVPHSVQLMGINLVVWRDAEGVWRAFKDCCPHRQAPLSEGRVDKATGNLSCNYHGWEFDGKGQCTHIPQQPADAPEPNPKRSCAVSFPTAISEDLLWIWADSGPNAIAESTAAVMSPSSSAGGAAAAAGRVSPHLGIAPELGLFGPASYWSTKFGFEKETFLGTWYQRFCNASYGEVKRNVFNDPSHDIVLHHGVGGLNRSSAAPADVMDFHMDDKGYSVKRLNKGSGMTVTDTCQFPVAIRRDFAGDPRFGAGVGYVTPTVPGRCNMIIGIVRYPQFAPKPRGIEALLGPLLPHTPKWLQHITMHQVVDADITMQAGIDVNESIHGSSGTSSNVGYMPAVGVDRGPIAFNQWLQKYGGGGPDVAMMTAGRTTTQLHDSPRALSAAAAGGGGGRGGGGVTTVTAGTGNIYPVPREQLLDRYNTHTKHCKACSTALANFKRLHSITGFLSTVLAAAALGTAAVTATLAAAAAAVLPQSAAAAAAVASASAVAQVSLWRPALLAVAAVVFGAIKAWASCMVAKFVFVDYDRQHVSKT